MRRSDFMELAKAMEHRRSIRAYKAGTTIEKSVIEELIKAAQLAPSWKNSQTALYYVVLSEEKLASVKEKCLPEFNRNNCADAPALIVTTFVKNRAGFERDGSPSTELGNEWGAYDLGLQNQNLLFAFEYTFRDKPCIGIATTSIKNKLIENKILDENKIIKYDFATKKDELYDAICKNDT